MLKAVFKYMSTASRSGRETNRRRYTTKRLAAERMENTRSSLSSKSANDDMSETDWRKSDAEGMAIVGRSGKVSLNDLRRQSSNKHHDCLAAS